jgi:hypothetical protein
MKITMDRSKYDTRHGGAFDRGAADSYYHRRPEPHYYVAGTYDSNVVEQAQMSKEEIEAYYAGYEWNEQYGDKKSWD